MEELFKDILEINGVQSVILLDDTGKVIYESMHDLRHGAKQRYTNWKRFLDCLDNVREADFLFDKGRIYIRHTDKGFVLICMQSFASIAMVKLNCDILLPQLKSGRTAKGLKGLFKR